MCAYGNTTQFFFFFCVRIQSQQSIKQATHTTDRATERPNPRHTHKKPGVAPVQPRAAFRSDNHARPLKDAHIVPPSTRPSFATTPRADAIISTRSSSKKSTPAIVKAFGFRVLLDNGLQDASVVHGLPSRGKGKCSVSTVRARSISRGCLQFPPPASSKESHSPGSRGAELSLRRGGRQTGELACQIPWAEGALVREVGVPRLQPSRIPSGGAFFV